MNIQNIKYLCINKKGFTLIEVLVSITIFVIVLGVTATIILSSQNIFKGNANITLGQQVGESVMSFIKEEIKYSTALNIKQSKTVDLNYTNALYIENGRIYYLTGDQFMDLYGDGFYNSFTIEAYINVDNIDLTNLTVVVLDSKEEELYRTSTVITFKNLQFNQMYFIYTPSGEMNLSSYSIYYNK